MKIAIACVDEQTISPHFGRAETYVVYSVDNGMVVNREVLAKQGHRQLFSEETGQHSHTGYGQGSRQGGRQGSGQGSGFGRKAKCKHEQMMENIKDCDVLLARGMGRGAYQDLLDQGIRPIITDIEDVESALQAVLTDTIIDHTEKLH